MAAAPKETVFDKIAKVKKAVVTACGLAAVIGTFLATADVSTPVALVTTAVGLVTVVGTWYAKNRAA
jgi:hypothetical protein